VSNGLADSIAQVAARISALLAHPLCGRRPTKPMGDQSDPTAVAPHLPYMAVIEHVVARRSEKGHRTP
jgi:hypothetical protein